MQLTDIRRKKETKNAIMVAVVFLAIPIIGATLSSVAFWKWVSHV